QPDEIAKQVKPTGKKTIAALISGKFKTAFPGGSPKEPAPADAKAKSPEPAAPEALRESKTSSLLILVADTDWLFDDYCVQKFDFMGQQAARPFNDNLAFAANSLDFLAGSHDLISIRGKGDSVRHFTVVEKMQADASKKFTEKLSALEARINEVQTKLAALQGKSAEGGKLLASPEAQKAIEDFQKQAATMRGERRGIRLSLREGIDSLENGLLLVNLLAMPVIVLAFGIWFYLRRRA
ncbi:MAG TPA: ABC transporter, partial [Opitutaceae bacterium]